MEIIRYTLGNSQFTFNGGGFNTHFVAVRVGDTDAVRIVNAYDARLVLLENTLFSDIEVYINNSVQAYTDIDAFLTGVNTVMFSRNILSSTAGGGDPANLTNPYIVEFVDINGANGEMPRDKLLDVLRNRPPFVVQEGRIYVITYSVGVSFITERFLHLAGFGTFGQGASNIFPIGVFASNIASIGFMIQDIENDPDDLDTVADIATGINNSAQEYLTSQRRVFRRTVGGEVVTYIYTKEQAIIGGTQTDVINDDFSVISEENDPSNINQNDYVVVRPFGNPFQLRKDPANDNPDNIGVLETNDIILNGFNVDDTEFWEAAKYIGTDPANDINLPASYVVLGGGGGTPQVQSDFAETDSALPSFILNKITNTSDLINDGDGNAPFVPFNSLPSVPTVTSDLTNDGNGIEPFLTDSDVAGTYRRLDDSNIYTPGDLATENIGLADYYDIGNISQPYYHIKLPYDNTEVNRYTVSIRGASTGSKTSIDIRYIGQMFSSNGIVNDFTSIIHDNTDASQGIAGAGQYVSSDGFAVLWFQLQNTGNSTRFRVDSMLTGSGDIINDGEITISQTDSTTPTI